jgi:hypothetical protein
MQRESDDRESEYKNDDQMRVRWPLWASASAFSKRLTSESAEYPRRMGICREDGRMGMSGEGGC